MKPSEIWKEVKPRIGEMLVAVNDIETRAEKAQEEAYQHGLNDAREGKASCEFCEYEMCSDRADPCRICACNYMNLFKPKKQEKEEYHTGDEVIRHYKSEYAEGDDAPSIFLSEEDGHFRCLAFNGRSIMIAEYPKNQYRKTGRHFPEIASVLQKMRES